MGSAEFEDLKDIPKDERYHAVVDYSNQSEDAVKTVGELQGFEQGDVIMEINGEKISSSYGIIKMMIYAFPGDEWNIKFRRGDDVMHKTIALREMDRTKLLNAVSGRRGGR